MLNNYKKINLEKKSSKIDSFWKTPIISRTAKFQMHKTPQLDFLEGLPVVFGQQPKPSKAWWKKKRNKPVKYQKLHFFFSAIVFNSIFLFKKFPKNKNIKINQSTLKKKVLLINKLFHTKTRYKGYMLKQKKGGYFTSSLGFRSFMPKSHSDRLLTHKDSVEWLLGLKFSVRRRRFSANQKSVSFNLVSSSKSQQKGSFLKKNEQIGDKSFYSKKVAEVIKKRCVKTKKNNK